MKFSFRSFVIGFGCAAISLGAVTYATAASNGTLKACANKTSGVMRNISKGSCKKTEKSLSWSQMGPQGLPGDAGTKGDSGAVGTNGTNGTNGQNFHVIDADAKDLGIALTSTATGATVFFDGGIWSLSNTTDNQYKVYGDLTASAFHTESTCSSPFWYAPTQSAILVSQARGNYTLTGITKHYKPTGIPFLGSTTRFYARYGAWVNGVGTCIEITNNPSYANTAQLFATTYFTTVVETTPPTFTAPFTLVAK